MHGSPTPRWISTAVCLAVLTVAVPPVPAQNAIGELQAIADNPDPGELFGEIVALQGRVGAVGEPLENGGTGVVHVYRSDGRTWYAEQTLMASDAAANDNFGKSVAIFDEVLVTGAPRNSDAGSASGSVYVFRFDGASWVEEAKLTASDASKGDRFGHTVAAADGVIAVGAPLDDDLDTDAGSIYVFRFDGASWIEEAELFAADGAPGDLLGQATAMDQDVIVSGTQDQAGALGAAYVFRDNGTTWVEEAKLTASDGAAGDRFGNVVDVRGDWVAVGAYQESAYGPSSGAVYLYEHQTTGPPWVQRQKLVAYRGGALDEFGWSLSLADDFLLIGAHFTTLPQLGTAGAAWVFFLENGLFRNAHFLSPSDAAPFDRFGQGVAADGDMLLVGASLADPNGNNSGKVYFFRNRFDHCRFPPERQKIVSPFPGNIRFGSDVDHTGDVMVVGASEDGTGSAHIYRRVSGSWSFEQRVMMNPSPFDNTFGKSVATDGSIVVAGAPQEYDTGSQMGAAYVYRHDGLQWIFEQRLAPADRAQRDEFGTEVAVAGDWIAVGSPGHDLAAPGGGTVYFYEWDGATWNETKLVAANPESFDGFGIDVALDGNRLAVGGQGGSVFVFEHDGVSWTEQAELATRAHEDLDLCGSVIVVGTNSHDVAGLKQGSAEVFRYDGAQWVMEQKLVASDAQDHDDFGHCVAVEGSRIVVGALAASDRGKNSGGAYLFRHDGATWIETSKLLPVDAVVPLCCSLPFYGWRASLDGGSAVVTALLRDLDGAASYFEPWLALDVDPDTTLAGDSLSFRVCEGMPGTLGLLYVLDVSGVPFFVKVASGLFDNDFEWLLPTNTPPGLEGLNASFMAFGINTEGHAQATDPATLQF